MSPDLEERIRQRAYEIWQRSGHPEGREQEHWEQAQREIAQQEAATVSPSPTKLDSDPREGASAKTTRSRSGKAKATKSPPSSGSEGSPRKSELPRGRF